MRTYTNLAWPDDPYRASQQLYRRPSPLLAAFTILPPGQCPITAPAAIAAVYLPLHRTHAVTVTGSTVSFGFRAASTADAGCLTRLAEIADLDLIQARRHAKYLAGHALSPCLHALREAAPGMTARGLAAVEADWTARPARARGTAEMIDIGDGRPDLADTCQHAAITISAGTTPSDVIADDPGTAERLAAAATERALAIALTCARELGRYQWEGALRTAALMAAAAWDLFPVATWDDSQCD
jgi:hypothetical protein